MLLILQCGGIEAILRFSRLDNRNLKFFKKNSIVVQFYKALN